MQGFLILNCIVGGQTLASVSNGHLDDTLGIVIIGVISLVVRIDTSTASHALSVPFRSHFSATVSSIGIHLPIFYQVVFVG